MSKRGIFHIEKSNRFHENPGPKWTGRCASALLENAALFADLAAREPPDRWERVRDATRRGRPDVGALAAGQVERLARAEGRFASGLFKAVRIVSEHVAAVRPALADSADLWRAVSEAIARDPVLRRRSPALVEPEALGARIQFQGRKPAVEGVAAAMAELALRWRRFAADGQRSAALREAAAAFWATSGKDGDYRDPLGNRMTIAEGRVSWMDVTVAPNPPRSG